MTAQDLISLETYNQVMRILAPLLAVLFWGISAWFIWYGRRNKVWRRYLGMWAWTINVALFWTYGAYLRLATDYQAPTTLLSMYSVILYLQAAFSMMAALIFFRVRAPTLPMRTDALYSSLEIGPDDN